MGVENQSNAERALQYVKDTYECTPLLVTTDFSPNLTQAVINVFGADVLQIDGFHVMQELNRGIRHDIRRLCHRLFQAEVKELYALRDYITEVQQALNHSPQEVLAVLTRPPSVNASHQASTTCLQATLHLLETFATAEPSQFLQELQARLKRLPSTSHPAWHRLVQAIQDRLPVRALTVKGQHRLQEELLKRLKSVYLSYRTLLTAASRQFYHDHWLVFYQPERLTPERHKRLETLLTQYPALQEYRALTLQLGTLYRRPVTEIDDQLIDRLESRPYYSKKLQTAIKTIKKFKSAILRFTHVAQTDPQLALQARTSMEYYHNKVKASIKAGLSRTGTTHLLTKMQLQLRCPVRFIDTKEIKGRTGVLQNT